MSCAFPYLLHYTGIGFTVVIVNIFWIIYGVQLRVWVLEYLVNSFQEVLPWSTCNNTWNTIHCSTNTVPNPELMLSNSTWIDFGNQTYSNGSLQPFNYSTTSMTTNNTMQITPEEEFWTHKVLDVSPGIGEFGAINWMYFLYQLVLRLMAVLSLIKHIASLEKVRLPNYT